MRRAALRSPEPVEGRSSVVGRRSWFDQLTMSGRPSPAHPELVEGRSSVVGKPVLSLSKDRSSPLRHSSLRQAQDRLFALRLYATGLLWGLLPCGLVLTALLAAATTGSPLSGALTMFAFGAGTWPALLAIHLIHLLGRSGRPSLRYWKPQSATPLIPTSTGEQYRGAPSSPFPLGRGLGGRSPAALSRWAAASITLLFGVQMAFRGLAAGGWLAHLHIGRVMLW
ncbi:MAG: sulfite exporter TauE/SafE family protein [Chloroflexi bacterium]|nr:sulfite exporter TauE/SafE family protein [Chloroflexota bacterium]